jgi:hypothetical protein
MPDVTADPPARSCNSPVSETRNAGNQSVGPDLSCPRARAREGTPTKLGRPKHQEAPFALQRFTQLCALSGQRSFDADEFLKAARST